MMSLKMALSRQENVNIVRTPVSTTPEYVTKEKVKRPTVLQDIFRKKYQKRSVYYFTQDRKLNPKKMRHFDEEKTPYWFPPEEEEFSYKVVYNVWKERFRKEEQTYKYHNRPNYRSRQTEDLLERLHVPDDPQELPKVPGILDIDPHYFSIVAGRPFQDNEDIRQYLKTLQQTLTTRLRIGYVQDDILQVDEQNIDEQEKINAITKEHKIYMDAFEEFLAKDYDASMACLSKVDKVHAVSRDKEVLCKELNRDVGMLKTKLYNLEEQWRSCKIFQTFLYKVSPLPWRQQYDNINPIKDKSDSLDGDADVFGRYRLASSGSVASLDALIDMFLVDTKDEQKPELYFTEPRQLLEIFEIMEHRSLNCLLFNELILVPLQDITVGLIRTRNKIQDEFNFINDKLHDVELAIHYEELREENLKSVCDKLIETSFKKLVVSDDTLELYVHVKNAFQAINPQEDSKLGVYEMMKYLEIFYSDLLLQMEYLPQHIVKHSEKTVFLERKRIMRDAKDAWKKKIIIEMMFASLSKAFEPIIEKSGKEPKPRSAPAPLKKKAAKVEARLTEHQEEMLNFFTTYCRYSDDYKTFLELI